MKPKTKKILIIASIIIALIVIFKFLAIYLKKKQAANLIGTGTQTNEIDFGAYETQPANVLNVPTGYVRLASIYAQLVNKYGHDIAMYTEKIFILETTFNGQPYNSPVYLNTGTAGILAFNCSYAYGWQIELQPFWEANTDKKPVGIFKGGTNHFLQFYNSSGFFNVAEILSKKHRIGAYNSTVEAQQISYENSLNQIQNVYVI